jgi:hypothetical protein
MDRKSLSAEFDSRTDVGGEDTMGTGRPSGMSTINPTNSALHSFEGTSLIRLVLHIINNIQNDIPCKT